MQRFLEKIWYEKASVAYLLSPLSWLYQFVMFCRYYIYKWHKKPHYPIPIIVVGNLTVGGVGKTPLVVALVDHFIKKKIRVGVISRGYKARIKKFPYVVTLNDHAEEVGDEPLLLASKCACPVVISPKRCDAIELLINQYQCELIISDDGLQHYAMPRAIEIAVIDGLRGLGNKLCLPAGPLREPPGRLTKVDLLVVNQGQWPCAYPMTIEPQALRSLSTGAKTDLNQLAYPVAALAAIGNPERFFNTLTDLGISFTPYVFPDHHQFSAYDLKVNEKTVIMTEKDAVKCKKFGTEYTYVLPIKVFLPDFFWQALDTKLSLKGYFFK